jgi:hypothetical protein
MRGCPPASNSHGGGAVAPFNAGGFVERGRLRPRVWAWGALGMLGLFFAACQQTPKASPYVPLVARLFLETRAGEAGSPVRLPVSGVTINVSAKPVIVEYDVRNAEAARVDLGPCLLLQVSPAAARDLYRLSVSAMGRRLVLVLNDEPVGVHRIEQALADGTILVFVERPDVELPALVERLKRTTADIAAATAKK